MLDKKQKNCVDEIGGEWDWRFGLLANICLVTEWMCGFWGDSTDYREQESQDLSGRMVPEACKLLPMTPLVRRTSNNQACQVLVPAYFVRVTLSPRRKNTNTSLQLAWQKIPWFTRRPSETEPQFDIFVSGPYCASHWSAFSIIAGILSS